MATSLGTDVVRVDKDGRKRLRPTLIGTTIGLYEQQPSIAAGNNAEPIIEPSTSKPFMFEPAGYLPQRSLGRRAVRTPDKLYLGLEPLSVDTMFYGNTGLEQTLDQTVEDSPDVTVTRCYAPRGQQSYVNARIKYFLRSPWVTLQRDADKHVGIVAYPDRLGKKNHPLSITVFSKSSNGIAVSRSNRAKWITDRIASTSTTFDGNPSNGFRQADPAVLPAHDEDAKRQARLADRKWNNSYGKRDELPPYGESASEGDDPKTMREVKQEALELMRLKDRLKSKILSDEEVKRIIDIAMEHIVQDWIYKRQPKLQLKARRLWTKSRRDRSTQARVQNLNVQIGTLQARIMNYRDEIANEEWKKSGQVIKQCKILQPSIFDREDAKWTLATLMLRDAPPKPPPRPRIRTISKSPDEAEVIGAFVDVQLEDSDADFIVDDELLSPALQSELQANAMHNELRSTGMQSQFIDLTVSSDDETDADDAALAITDNWGKQSVDNDVHPAVLVKRQNRDGVLMWMLAHTPAARREAAWSHLRRTSMEIARRDITMGLMALLGHGIPMLDMDPKTSDNVMQLAVWRVCWTIPTKIDTKGVRPDHTRTTLSDGEGYELFYDVLLDCLEKYEGLAQRKVTFKASGYGPNGERNILLETSKTLYCRQDELEKQREAIVSAAWNTSVVVNPDNLDHHGAIFLNPRFGNGARIKPHQEEGLRFLWREIAVNAGLEGCLLAQTMGLGKTMQVIAFIVTLAEAAKSSNAKIKMQVPSSLRELRTLILCPPALVDNWWDELFLWVPVPHEEIIGPIRKVNAALALGGRLREIQAWNDKGGVLLMGYNTFKDLINNRAAKIARTNVRKTPPLNESQHGNVKAILTKSPTLIIADEAHAFKSPTSTLNKAMSQFKSKSRIALTGSPLNNHLEEYYTIIDWIAPEYLGSLQDFRETYGDPIREGLYEDSDIPQYRKARKMLKALELEMNPKVHRADASVLLKDLKGKTEFIIKVPITTLQESLYNIFVQGTHAESSGKEPQKATLWSWIGLLRLLCNHPRCYWNKLSGSSSGTVSPWTTQVSSNTGEDVDDVGSLTDIVSQDVMSATAKEIEKACFGESKEPLEAVAYSNKMQILMHILTCSHAVGDKTLVFSHSIPTLNYIGDQLQAKSQTYVRIDGSIDVAKRQGTTKSFNEGEIKVCLISTRAGGVGLNLYGANRVVILDEHFNPMWEQQAIGRAYRIGQRKPVFVYRLTVAGTFEQAIQNQALFKEQLATRVVDKRNPTRRAYKSAGDYLFPPKHENPQDLKAYKGRDPFVLDRILGACSDLVLGITPTDTFQVEDGFELSTFEEEEAISFQLKEQLRRRNLKVQPQERIRAVQQATSRDVLM
ncbi:hypothetical protein P7C71_g825, partial [Lecanoromycetidae sp. Uapishka_2]